MQQPWAKTIEEQALPDRLGDGRVAKRAISKPNALLPVEGSILNRKERAYAVPGQFGGRKGQGA